MYKNDEYGYGRAMANSLDEIFFWDRLVADYERQLFVLTWHQLTVNHEFIRFDDFDLFSGFPLDQCRYSMLKNCFNRLKKKVWW